MKKKRKLRKEVKDIGILLPFACSLAVVSCIYHKENKPVIQKQMPDIVSDLHIDNMHTTTKQVSVPSEITHKEEILQISSAESENKITVLCDFITSDISENSTTTETSTVGYTPEKELNSNTDEYNTNDDDLNAESTETETNIKYVSDLEYIMLCNCVAYEAGSDWISTYDKSKVVEVIMNRVESPDFPNTIYEVLTEEGQFSGVYNYIYLTEYSHRVTDDVIVAVNMFFDENYCNNGYLFFSGDGNQNYFT